MYTLLKFVPKNWLSLITGWLAQIRMPSFLNRKLLCWYCCHYSVNQEEIELPLEKYPTLGAFFVRNLKDGVRPIGDGLVSPVDGKIQEHGGIYDGRLLQVKGKEYELSELIGDIQLAQKFNGGYFLTIYLSPSDYHHIHAPVDGDVIRSIYIPGTLWPVNQWSVQNIDRLFAVNERLISVIESAAGEVLVVKVGATNVGSISVEYDNLRTNTCPFSRKAAKLVKNYSQPYKVKKGDRLGTFNLGSTVILIFEPGHFSPSNIKYGQSVHFGQTLGHKQS